MPNQQWISKAGRGPRALTLLTLAASLASACDSDDEELGARDASRSGMAEGSEVVIEVSDEQCSPIAINQGVGQSFVLPRKTALDSIELWVRAGLYYPSSLQVDLFAGEGIGGTLIASSEIVDLPPREEGQDGQWEAFDFTAQPMLEAGTYTLRLTRLSTSAGAFSRCGDIYPDGVRYGFSGQAVPYADVSFRVIGNVCSAIDQLLDSSLDCGGPELLLWLDAADREQTRTDSGPALDGEAITQWLDKSGLGHDAIAYAPSKQAELDTDAFGGLPAVRFENDFMEIRDLDLRPSVHQSITAFAVVRRLGGYPNIWVAQENGFNKRTQVPSGAEVDARVVSTLVIEGQPDNLRHHWLAGGDQVSESKTYSEGSEGVGLGQLLYAWDGYAGAYATNYELAELVIFDGVLPESDRVEIEEHLVDKWATDVEVCPNPGADPLPDPGPDNWPHFVDTSYIDLDDIGWVSKYRSTIGHDYSDNFEHCRSMKHYFYPADEVDWGTVEIRSPVAGTVVAVQQETFGTRVQIRSSEQPEFDFLLFHVELDAPLAVGATVLEGEVLGVHWGSDTYSDIAVSTEVNGERRLVSWFDVMSDDLLAEFQARGGITSRDDAIISKAERDADPLCCTNGQFDDPPDLADWVELDGNNAAAPPIPGLAAPLEAERETLGFR